MLNAVISRIVIIQSMEKAISLQSASPDAFYNLSLMYGEQNASKSNQVLKIGSWCVTKTQCTFEERQTNWFLLHVCFLYVFKTNLAKSGIWGHPVTRLPKRTF